jgi:TonB-linked SusC/RagA family outer membrane protein
MRIFTISFKSLLFTPLILGSCALFAQQANSSKDKITAPVKVSAKDKGITIKGTIKEASTNKPLAGINISVFEYSAAISGDKGEFTIKVPDDAAVLTISGPGFQSKDIPLKGRKSVSVSLFEDTYNSVYDIAKTPFGSIPQNQSVNAQSSINTQGGWETSNETADSYLQGKVAGLNAVRRSGTPGIGANLFLRGFSSLYGTNKPLVVVDGMIYDNNHYGNSLIGGHVYNPLEQLDIKDIENITVIKDGAATVYGTRAANGVILISTLRAQDLATHIDFGVYGGFNFTPSNIPLLKAADYRTYLSDVLRTSGSTDAQIQAQPYMNDVVGSATYAQYHNNTDWQKQVFKNSYSTNYYLKVSGGDEIAKYALSLGYLGNDGITQQTDLTRYNTRFNADLNLTKKFTATASLSFSYSQQNLHDQGTNYKINPIYASQIKSPLIGVHAVNAQGVESPNITDVDIFNTTNPYALINSAQETNKSYRFFGIVNFKYQFNKYLNLQTGIGVTSDKVRENTFIPRGGVVNDTLSNAIADSRMGSQVQRLYSIYNDTHLSFDKTFNRIHHVSANVGFRYNSNNTQDNYSLGYNSATDQLISVGTGSTLLRRTGGDLGKWNSLNNYLGVDYQLLGKYLFSYNMAVDASSRFGTQVPNALTISGTKFAVLPSIAAGWLISSEKFMSKFNFIELLKLRASYGLTGNDDIGNYTARQYYVSQNLLGMQGLVRGNIGNPQLQWEQNKKANIGIDASFLNERLSVSIDAYQNTTDKMVVYEPQPTAAGFNYAITNNGGMRSKGLEFAVNARIINHANIKWDVGANIAAYRNKITKMPGTQMLTNYAGATVLTAEGLPANLFYGYKTDGVYTSDAEAATAGTNHQGISIVSSTGALSKLKGGDVRFVDTNGDNIIDSKDMQVIGNPNPAFTGAFNTKFSYKRFTLDALFTFTKGNDVYNYTRRILESESGYNNQTLAVVNRWRADGQVTDMPKATYGDPMGNARFSDRWIEDGSYLRLRTISLSYNIPVKTKILKSLNVYLTGNNVFTLSKYLGYDPEFSATESVLTQGIDTNLEPVYRSVQLGIRLGL